MRTRNAFYFALKMLSLCVFTLGVAQAQGADYPERPIKVVVPWGAGGGSDQMTRAFIKAAESVSDANFAVQNMPGASGEAGLNYVMKQPADGYTIYEALTDQLVQMARGSTNYRLGKDIQPLARSQAVPNFLFINPKKTPFSSFDEMIKYAKAHDKRVKIATNGLKSFDTLMLGTIEDKYDVNFKYVPFNKVSERYAALQGGFVDVLFEQIGDVKQFVKSGKFKPILVYGKERLKDYPGVPTTVEKGIDNTTLYTRGFWVRSGTPKQVITHLNKIFAKAAETKEWKSFNKRQKAIDHSYQGSKEYQNNLDAAYNLLESKIK